MIETVKGFRDILPLASLKRRKIIETIEEKFRLFGFLPVETPTIEYEDLLKGDNEEDEAVSDMFRLKDRANRSLGLRYEFTFQLSRIFKENLNIKLPFRRYQIGSVFRDEALKPGKFREFIQCDADIIGDDSVKADAECLALGNEILKELKIKAEIRINNRKLLNSILNKLEIKNNNKQILREIDKLDKLQIIEVKNNLKNLINEDTIKKLFSFFEKDLDYFIKNKFEGAEEIEELIKIGKLYNLKIKFFPTLMRGFSYYTGNIWEIWSQEIKVALAGGGRYDDKVGKYINRKIPSVGISFGKLIDWEKINVNMTNCLIISIDKDKEAVKLAVELRKNKISAIISNKISKALEYANSYSIPFVVFIGKKEIKEKKIKLRNMRTGKEELYNVDKLISFFQKQKNDTFK